MKGYEEQRGLKLQMIFDPTTNSFVQRILGSEFSVHSSNSLPETEVKEVIDIVPHVMKKIVAVRGRWHVAGKPQKRAG